MKRHLKSLFLVLACSALLSCSKTNDPAGGSQTHFLESCEQGCAAPYTCLCGVCTLPCSKDSTCSPHAGAATCAEPTDDGADCGGATEQLCDVECTQRSECASLGAEFSCIEGRCRATQIVPEAGRGGDSGSGATVAGRGAGTGGSEAGTQAGRSGAGAGAGSGTAGAGGSASGAPLCDGSDDVWLWIGAEGGGPLEPTFTITNPHGHSYLMIDGHCRYYGFREIMVGTKTGTVTEAEARQIANEVGYDRLVEWDPHQDAPCPDAGVQFISRPGARAWCSCGCDEMAPAGLGNAMRAAFEWSTTLAERGKDMDGPIAAIASVQMMASVPPIPWSLTRAIMAIPGFVQDANAPGKPVRFEGADAAELRAIRSDARNLPQSFNHAFVEDLTGRYDVFMHDELPAAIEASLAAFPSD